MKTLAKNSLNKYFEFLKIHTWHSLWIETDKNNVLTSCKVLLQIMSKTSFNLMFNGQAHLCKSRFSLIIQVKSYNLSQNFWNTCTISVAHLVELHPPPQNNVVVNMVKRHNKCRYAWRLVSGKYTLNSTLFQGKGVSLVRHRQKYYNHQIPWINWLVF